jgi:Fis family transcriptional regulator
MNASFSTAQVTTLHEERRKSPLRDNVKNSLRLYLNSLSGHEPEELYKMFTEEVERPLLETVMEYCNGNQTKAARYLGLNRGTLRKKLKLYGLN